MQARRCISSSSFAFSLSLMAVRTGATSTDPEQEGKRCCVANRDAHRTAARCGHGGKPPAYPQTAAAITDRSLPASMPVELRSRILARAADDECQCDCAECEADDCVDCRILIAMTRKLPLRVFNALR
jgi:hypothetical protein